jgi:hypothetical protein
MKHTPGPWNAQFNFNKAEEMVISVSSPDGFTICKVFRDDSVNEFGDAQLIAAAPTMYLALLALQRGPGCFCEIAIGNPMMRDHSGPCLMAKAAIAKAEGK